MNQRPKNVRLAMPAAALLTATMLTSSGSFAADAEAAEGLARQSGCYKCHAVATKKVGPALKDAAAKYKGDKDAVAKLTAHVTGAGKMNYGGKEEPHPGVKSKKPADVKNLVDWILSM